jgi:NADPH:quinone reductase
MEELMKAICLTSNNGVRLQDVPKPIKAEQGHLLIKMEACGINAGDIAFIGGTFAKGSIPISQYDICGVSGVGTVIEIGEGVPSAYKNKKVTVYRSLKYGVNIIGTWCEYAHLPFEHCAILPENLNAEDYSGSLVNIITAYSFLKQVTEEGHKGIICTAGNSATGIAMLGIGIVNDFPIISIVRTQDAKKGLEELGAKNILVQSDNDFKQQLKDLSEQLSATAVFDGVGGEILNRIIDVLPFNSTIYSYGYLGGKTPLTIHTSILMKGITIKAFSNFRTKTVQDKELLEKALNDISEIIEMPHFKIKAGKKFRFEDVNEALRLFSSIGEKAVLYPFTIE